MERRQFSTIIIAVSLLITGVVRGEDLLPPDTTVQPDPDYAIQAPPKEERAASGGFGGVGPGAGTPGYRATWYPSVPVTGSPRDFGLLRQSLSTALPVWHDDGEMVMLTTDLRHTLFFTDAILPDTQRVFPEELWNVNVGLMYMHKFDNGWSSMVSTTIGSASDKPFHSIEEMNLGFLGCLQIPAMNDRDLWNFSLMYSPTGNVNSPIPGVAYFWKPTDDLHVNIGIPFSLMWKPTADLTVNFSYIPITNVTARVTYQLWDKFALYGGFEWLNEAYFLADRAEYTDRFLALEKRLVCGVRWDFWTHAALDLNAGYAFDRYYGEGRNQFSSLHDRIDVDPGAFLGANLIVKW